MPPLPTQFSRVPPEARLCRGDWSHCAMERSRIGAVSLDTPAADFHHLALSLDRVPRRVALTMDGRRRHGRNTPDALVAIAAGAGGLASWDASFDAACFYFSDAGLSSVLGEAAAGRESVVGTSPEYVAPRLTRLLHALSSDAEAGQPHGRLVGDAIFMAIAATLMTGGAPPRPAMIGTDWRVGRALAFIHAYLAMPLSIDTIAGAATTSPFHLNTLFRATIGLSIWRYVLRERARHAAVLMRDPALTLAMVSQLAGFDTYAGFIASFRREFGLKPAIFRAAL